MGKITLFSWACVLLIFTLALLTWMQLPELTQYPVHWDARGLPDRYGSKLEVAFSLFVMPVAAVFIFLVFVLIPKIEPVRANVTANMRPYTYIWVLTMLLLVGVSGFISYSYTNLELSPERSKIPISFLVITMSAFFIFIGNIMGKFKRNFLIGVRTPWTLSSDLAWDKTHRLVGKMFVGLGVVSMIATFVTRDEIALYTLIGLSIFTTVFSVIYSFIIWKNDPDKRN